MKPEGCKGHPVAWTTNDNYKGKQDGMSTRMRPQRTGHVVRADSSAGFVQDDTGKVDEDGFAEGDFVGEITEFAAGTSSSGTFELTPATYILFCNIVDEEADGTFESHFMEGMQSTLVVE